MTVLEGLPIVILEGKSVLLVEGDLGKRMGNPRAYELSHKIKIIIV